MKFKKWYILLTNNDTQKDIIGGILMVDMINQWLLLS